eukprot:772358-Pyramimonas_sp.AAC.1
MSMCQSVVVFCALLSAPGGVRGLLPGCPSPPFSRVFLLAARTLSPLSTALLSPASMPSCSWPVGSSQPITHSCRSGWIYPPGSGASTSRSVSCEM